MMGIPCLLRVVCVPTVCGIFGQQEKAVLILTVAGAVIIGSLVERECGMGPDVMVDQVADLPWEFEEFRGLLLLSAPWSSCTGWLL
jgi:hypothetical protein